jgi:hypothetical protein
MRSYFLIAGIVLLLVHGGFGQRKPRPAPARPEAPKAIKFAEFGDVGRKEFYPNLDRFREELIKNKTFTGWLVFYNSYRNTPFKQSAYYTRHLVDKYSRYLGSGDLYASRMFTLQGGFLDKAKTELWLVPPGASAPAPDKKARAGSLPKFVGELMFTVPVDLTDAEIDTQEAGGQDESGEMEDEDDAEPGSGDDEDDSRFSFEFLAERKDARGVIIFYFDETGYDIGAARNIIEEKLKNYGEKHQIDTRGVKVVFGGYREEPEIEGWAVLVNGPDPEPIPGEKLREEPQEQPRNQ